MHAVLAFSAHIVCLCLVLRCFFVVVDHLCHPLDGILHLALQEGVHTQLITQVLLRLLHLSIGVLNLGERLVSCLVVFAGEVHVCHQGIHFVGIFCVGVLGQEVLEGGDVLTQSRSLQVGDLHIVVHGLFTYLAIDIQLHGCGV